MSRSSLIALALSVFVVLPIWYFLLYRILVAVNATELSWFLYYAYVPIGLLTAILAKIGEQKT